MVGVQRELEGRDGDIWKRVAVQGWSHERCAKHFGLSRQRVDQIVAKVREHLRPYLAEEMVQQSMEFLRDVQSRAYEIVELAGAPVAVGKDGTILTEPCDCLAPEVCDHPPKIVRDYSGRLNALRLAHDVDKSVRKLHGLDAPEKREMSGNVRYEIVGVDDDDLT